MSVEAPMTEEPGGARVWTWRDEAPEPGATAPSGGWHRAGTTRFAKEVIMATTSRAIVPAHNPFLARRPGRTARPAIAAIAVAGILVAGAAAFAISRVAAAGVAAAGGTGHAAPVTSTLERALEARATSIVPWPRRR
jgi:hypothetical protein